MSINLGASQKSLRKDDNKDIVPHKRSLKQDGYKEIRIMIIVIIIIIIIIITRFSSQRRLGAFQLHDYMPAKCVAVSWMWLLSLGPHGLGLSCNEHE